MQEITWSMQARFFDEWITLWDVSRLLCLSLSAINFDISMDQNKDNYFAKTAVYIDLFAHSLPSISNIHLPEDSSRLNNQ